MAQRDARRYGSIRDEPGARSAAVRTIGRAALLTTAFTAVTACATTVTGTPAPEPAVLTGDVASGTAPAPERPLATLLLPPDRFPESYSAVVLPAPAVAQAAPDLAGIPQGAKVDPAGCLPPRQDYGPAGTAMAVGTDNASRATISVEVVASGADLDGYRTYVTDCGSVEATHRGVTATVTTTLGDDPGAPVAGAGTLALTRSVRSGQGDDAVVQSMHTRIAQIGDVRVLVTYMSFDSGPADFVNLDRVYRDAVLHAAGG